MTLDNERLKVGSTEKDCYKIKQKHVAETTVRITNAQDDAVLNE